MSKNYLFDTTNYQDRGGRSDPPSGNYVTQEELDEAVNTLEGQIDTVSGTAHSAYATADELSTAVGEHAEGQPGDNMTLWELAETAFSNNEDTDEMIGNINNIDAPAQYRTNVVAAINYNRGSIDENTDRISAIEQSIGEPSSVSETMDVWQAIESLRTRVAALEGNS